MIEPASGPGVVVPELAHLTCIILSSLNDSIIGRDTEFYLEVFFVLSRMKNLSSFDPNSGL